MGENIRIECVGADHADISNLKEFQGNLKDLSEESYQRLRKDILTLGFSEPISVWKNNGQLKILSGHQRLKALNRMKAEGFTIPPIPINYIDAVDEKEAKKKVLSLTSQFGEITGKGLKEFADESGITFDEMKDAFRFPEIDFNLWVQEFSDNNIESVNRGDEQSEWMGMPEFDPKNKEPKLVLIFKQVQDREKFISDYNIKVTNVYAGTWTSRI